MSERIELDYSEQGEGRPLVVLHGLFGSARNWTSVARRLAAKWRVICVDLRNHGRSPHLAGMDYLSQSGDLLHLLDKLALKRVHLLGHSMGGKVAMSCALRAPERIDKLIIEDIAPVAYRHRFADIFAAMSELDPARIRDRRDADAKLSVRIDSPILRQFLLQNLVREERQFAWRINLPALAEGMAEIADFPLAEAAPFTGKTLFIAGADSGHIRPEHHHAMQGLFPGHRLESIRAAGHWPHSEQFEAFCTSVENFLGPDPTV